MTERPSPIARFFGYALITVGTLMAFLSGACTLVFFTMGLQQHLRGDLNFVWLSLGFGLPFIGIGVALVFGGRALSRKRDGKDPRNMDL